MAKKKGQPSPEKAREMLHNPPHGKPLSDKQRKYFGYLSSLNLGGKMQNENNNFTHLPPGFVGSGYYNPQWKSPAWGGQFQMGGNIPGAVGFTYARTGSTPSNGKYAKKTKASAQSGASLFPIESWKKQGITSADTLQRGTMYRMPYIDQQRLYKIPIPLGVHPNDMGYMTAAPGQENPNDLFKRRFSASKSFSSDTSYSGIKKTSHINGMELQDGGMVYYQHGTDFKTKGMQDGGIFDVKSLKKRNQKRDSVRQTLYDKYPHDYQKVNNGMLDYFQQEAPINDNRGQYNHPGKVTKINSPNITMTNVPYPVLGISDTGHSQLMQPDGQYQFHGNSVTEYPLNGGNQNKGQLKKLRQLTDFSNNNNMEQAKSGIHIKPSHKGLLHKNLGVPAGKKIPASKLAVKSTDSTAVKKRKVFAQNAKKWHHAQNGYQGPNLSQYNTTAPNFGPPQGMSYQPLNLGSQVGQQIGQQAPNTGYGNYQAPQLNLNQNLPAIKVSGLDKLSVIGGVVKGIKMLKQEKIQARLSRQNAMVSGLVADASATRPEAVKRKYVRPEDQVIQPDQLSPSTGVGTNYLSGKNGLSIMGEIQNTYAPNTLYTDLGYEPLNDSKKVKNFQYGGVINTAAGAAGSAIGSSIGGGNATTTPNGGAVIGGTVGGAIGSYFGPIGRWVGNFAGSAIGGALDRNGREISKYGNQTDVNTRKIAFQEGTRNLQTQNSSFMENGGWLSHNWNPQVITKFGDYTAKEVHNIAHEGLHSLRTGGNIRQNTMALGGELKVHGGGHAESLSSNPYLPGDGETVMFRGKSHAEGGMPISFGKQGVEVEGGEPAVKLEDGGKGDNLVVFGNMKIPSYGVNEIGDKDAKGMKFKNYIAKLSEREEKQNKTVSKGLKLINDTDDRDAFDQLKIASGKAMLEGGNMKLKLLAEQKQAAGNVQNAILETAHEHNLDSDALAKGKIKKAKNGAKMTYAQDGSKSAAANLFGEYFDKISNYISPKDTSNYIHNLKYARAKDNPNVLKKDAINNTPSKGSEDYNKWFSENYAKNKGKVIDSPWGKQLMELAKPSSKSDYVGIKDIMGIPSAPEIPSVGVKGQPSITPIYPSDKQQAKQQSQGIGALGAFSQLWPYFRPTNQMQLDPNQLAGEYYALSNNTLDPVNAQRYTPLLDQPYDISFQDQLNANQSDFNALQRQTTYNPAAQSILAGQKYAANSNVLGSQFRANQANKAGIYSKNRDIVNDASLKNLALLDQQYVRQSQAKSNTKAIAQQALSSISSKIQQNKLENRTLGVYENLYGYRYDDKGRAFNLNAPYEFNVPQAGQSSITNSKSQVPPPSGYEYIYNAQGEPIDIRKAPKGKNGYLVKALK